MPTLINASALAGFVPPDSSIARPGKTNHSPGTQGRLRDRRFTRPTARLGAKSAHALADEDQPVVVDDFSQAGTDAFPPHPQSSNRPAERLLNWLRTGAAVGRYSWRFLPAVLRPHSFAAPAALPVLRMKSSLPNRRIGEWKTFFRSPTEATPPFTYFTAENTRLLFGMLGRFGPNFRNILLVQHDFIAPSDAGCLIPDAEYELEARVEELRVWPRQRVTLAFRCVARRAGHSAPVFETSDRFLVKDVPVQDCEALQQRVDVLCSAGKEAPAPRLDPTSPSVRSQRLRVPIDAGVRFGLLSGDLNLVHAHVGLARLFGHRWPFAQGRYTSNRVVAALNRLACRSPKRLSIRFCRPLFLGQDAQLLHSESAFEVLDPNGSLVAAGTFDS